MNNTQKEIIKELKEASKRLNKSPTRREVTRNLNNKCCKYFGSFNRAKIKAGLIVYNVRCDKLPKKAYKPDKDLVRLISYLTFDGHLYKSLRGFLLVSKDKSVLKEFESLIKNKFNEKGVYKKGMGYGESTNYRIYNLQIGKLLKNYGTPKGNKVLTEFRVPEWIRNNKKFMKEYLKIAFYCEGCMEKKNRPNPRISFNINKSEKLIKNGILFMNDLKDMLKCFDINTTNIGVIKGNIRKDGNITKMLRFRVLTEDNNKFINEIGWIK